MEDVHREALRRNHSMLVREMSPELVAEKLFSDCILTLEMKEVVFAQLTRFAKARKKSIYRDEERKRFLYYVAHWKKRANANLPVHCCKADIITQAYIPTTLLAITRRHPRSILSYVSFI